MNYMLCIIAFPSPMIDNEDKQSAIHICPLLYAAYYKLPFFGNDLDAANQETGIFAIEAWQSS